MRITSTLVRVNGEGLLRKDTRPVLGSFRTTAAKILDEAALSARLVADQLGHSRPAMTRDVYLGRRAVDSQAAVALEVASRDALPSGDFRGKTAVKDEGQDV